MQPDLFSAFPPQPPNRLTKLERRAVYHLIRFYLYRDEADLLDGKQLQAVYSAMCKLKPSRRSKRA